MSTAKKKKEPQAPAPMAALDHDTLAAARARIDAAATVLTGFHLRHKNQHRVSTYWWPALGQLRRHVRRIGSDLEKADKATRTKPAPKGDRSGSAEALVLARARWMRLHFVPKAYVAFSRLVADRQFAPLGLLLMGVLAQVHAVVHDLEAAAGGTSADETGALGKTERESDDDDDDDDDDGGGARPKDTNAAYRPMEPAADVGVAVPREREDDGRRSAGSTARPAKKRLRPDADEGRDAGAAAVSSSAAKRRKGERPGEDTPAAATAATAATATVGDDVPPPETSDKSDKKEKKEKKAKAKAKKRKRDEFDDLFNGLL